MFRALALALALLFASTLQAFAFSHVDGCTTGSATNLQITSCSLGSAQNSGNLVIGGFSWDFVSSNVLSSIKTDKGDTCTVIDDKQDTGSTFELVTFNCGTLSDGSQTISATTVGAQPFTVLMVDVYSGVTTLDQHAINDQVGVTSGITSGNVTTTHSNELVYGATVNAGSGTIGAGSGFTQRQNSAISGNDFGMTEDLLLASSGTTAATFTTSVIDDFITGVMTFYQPSTCPHTLSLLGVGC